MTKPSRIAALVAVAGLATAGCAEMPKSTAEYYPSGTVRIIAPFAAGGVSDTIARVAAKCLEDELGGTFIVENQDGGGGAIGMTRVARAEPDGYTLSVVTLSTAALVPLVTAGAQYDGSSFDPISGITLSPSVLVVKGDSPYRTGQDVLEAARKEGGTFSVAMPGSLGIFALAIKGIAEDGGPRFTNVPFGSNDQSAAAVLGGNVDSAYLSTAPTLLKQIESGKLRALATGARERLEFLPEVPTFAELGYGDLPDSTVNVALLAPAGIDGDVKSILAQAMGSCLKAPKTADVLGEEFVRDDDPGPEKIRAEMNAGELQWREAVEK